MSWVDISPFLTYTSGNSEYSDSDLDRDFAEMATRNAAIEDFLQCKISVHQLLEIVDESGISAEEYADQVVANVEHVLGSSYCQNTEGILIPYR